MKKAISLLLIITICSCNQKVDTGLFNNPIVWDVNQASSNSVYDGINYINKAFDKYDIVAIGESHGIIQVTDFYIGLANNEEFRSKVDVIVFEFGNSLFQKELDDYIFNRNSDSLKVKKLWREHTSSFLANGDRAGVNRFFNEVRKVNLNAAHQINILAAEPPIDWSKINASDEFFAFIGQRDKFYGDKVLTEVLKKNKKALLIMGSGHFNKSNKHGKDNPILAILRKTNNNIVLVSTMTMGDFPFDRLPKINKGELIETNNPIIGDLKLGSPFMKEIPIRMQTDALLFLGDSTELKSEEYAPFNDPIYESELSRRRSLIQLNKSH